MKSALCFVGLLIVFTGKGQSPYLSVILKMANIANGSIHYKIEMKICKLKKPSNIGDWFTHDTSTIHFNSLKASDLSCGDFFDKGLPTSISGEERSQPPDQFEYGNQNMAFEKILVFKISDVSHRNWIQPMFVVMPVKVKSFTTYIRLNDIVFHEDKVVYVDSINYSLDGNKMVMNYSLQNAAAIAVDDFFLFKN
jgi:hypothetical protein